MSLPCDIWGGQLRDTCCLPLTLCADLPGQSSCMDFPMSLPPIWVSECFTHVLHYVVCLLSVTGNCKNREAICFSSDMGGNRLGV